MNRKCLAAGLCLTLGALGVTATAIAAGPSAGGHSDSYVFYDDWSGNISNEVTAGTATDQVYVGKFDGTGASSLATRRGSVITLHTVSGGSIDEFLYWDPDSSVVAGDWDGTGQTTFGVRSNDTWYLRDEYGDGLPDYKFDFGTLADLVLVGDVDGRGSDAVVLRQGNIFRVHYADASDISTRTFGDSSDVTVVALGDWNGNGTDTPLVRDGTTYHAYNSWNYADGPAYSVTIGGPRNAVIVGDWNGDGKDTLGLRNFNFTAPGSGVQTTNALTTSLVESPEYRLRADAAASWEQVIEIWGSAFQINSAWRSYDTQVAIFEARYVPKASGGGEFCDVRTWAGTRYVRTSELGAAAIPGTSNHGAGTALDINGFEGFDDPVRLQLLALARDFGWSDSEGCAVNERWHFAYNPANDKGSTTWSASDPVNPNVSNCPNKVLTSSGTSTTAPQCTP
ncbi:MAG: M15 family metallopeptidase [Promicromonosporaceae bacterium]|nr:M15 family metallopeptidase [Promicromonosporaceae bacterium]